VANSICQMQRRIFDVAADVIIDVGGRRSQQSPVWLNSAHKDILVPKLWVGDWCQAAHHSAQEQRLAGCGSMKILQVCVIRKHDCGMDHNDRGGRDSELPFDTAWRGWRPKKFAFGKNHQMRLNPMEASSRIAALRGRGNFLYFAFPSNPNNG